MVVRIDYELHPGQQEIVNNAKRFNAVNCGRRFGKTELGKYLLAIPMLEGHPVGYFAPTYKDLSEVWREYKWAFHDIIERKDEQLKQIEIKRGGIIDFWSLQDPDSGRGRKYKRVIMDEVAKMKDPKTSWTQTIRPTLTDLKGDAFCFSTPKGVANDWYKFCQWHKTKDNWAYFHEPSKKNPYLDPEEIEAARRELPILEFMQEYEAEFVNIENTPFFPSFEDKMISKKLLVIDHDYPVWLSFDFNIDPTTVLIGQKIPFQGCFVIDCIQAKGGTEVLCDKLLATYDYPDMGYKVTGDFSGSTGSTVAGVLPGGVFNTDYRIIRDKLTIPSSHLIDTRTANARHEHSYRICDQFFRFIPFQMNDLTVLVNDLRTAQRTDKGKLRKDRNNFKQDAGDAFRYLVAAWFRGRSNEIVKFSKQFEE